MTFYFLVVSSQLPVFSSLFLLYLIAFFSLSLHGFSFSRFVSQLKAVEWYSALIKKHQSQTIMRLMLISEIKQLSFRYFSFDSSPAELN